MNKLQATSSLEYLFKNCLVVDDKQGITLPKYLSDQGKEKFQGSVPLFSVQFWNNNKKLKASELFGLPVNTLVGIYPWLSCFKLIKKYYKLSLLIQYSSLQTLPTQQIWLMHQVAFLDKYSGNASNKKRWGGQNIQDCDYCLK